MSHRTLSRRKLLRISAVAGGAALLAGFGCDGAVSNKKQTPAAVQPKPTTKLRVLVVDDAELGQAIEREWRSRTEGDLDIALVARADVAGASRLPADAVVFPAWLLGEFASRGLIRAPSQSLLSSEALDLRDVMPLTRLHEITWGKEIWALPLGSSQLVLAYRADLLEKHDLTVPATWEEYGKAVQKLSDRASLKGAAPVDQPWRGTAEPTGNGYGGSLLLARAAAYASHREQVSPLFDLANVEPLIDRPPFVRALSELAASFQVSDQPPVDSPAAAWEELVAGRCAIALAWPTSNPLPADVKLPPIAFAELPGSPSAFNFGGQRWEDRRPDEAQHVPLAGMAGSLVAVTNTTSQGADAEGLVGWLAGAEVSSRVASRSKHATLCRVSHRSALSQWCGGLPAAAAERYFDVTRQAQSRAQTMSTVQLPGSLQYLEALDRAVQRVTVDGQDPEASLRQAADDWRKITSAAGVTAQKGALMRSLDLDAD